MTKLLQKAIETALRLPPDEQDEIARAILQLAGTGDGSPVPLTDDERTAIARSKAAAARGEFATDEQVRAVWAKHGRSGCATRYRRSPTSNPFSTTSPAIHHREQPAFNRGSRR